MKRRESLDPKLLDLRSECLGAFRQRGYEFLASAIRESSGQAADLERMEWVSNDGQEHYSLVTAFWDGGQGRDIRVVAEVLSIPLKPLFGFIPLYLGGPSEDFIMRPDGSFVCE